MSGTTSYRFVYVEIVLGRRPSTVRANSKALRRAGKPVAVGIVTLLSSEELLSRSRIWLQLPVRHWWARLDSNQQPTGYEPGALPLSYGPAGTQFSIQRLDVSTQHKHRQVW